MKKVILTPVLFFILSVNSSFANEYNIPVKINRSVLQIKESLSGDVKCYGSSHRMHGYTNYREDNYIFKKTLIQSNLIVCTNGKDAISSQGSKMIASNDLSFYSPPDKQGDLLTIQEIIQVDLKNKKIIYSKITTPGKNESLDVLVGSVFLIGDLAIYKE